MTKLFTLILLFSLLFLSCKSNKESPYSKTIDSLATVLNSSDSIYTSINWDKAIEIEKNINTDVVKIDSIQKKLTKPNLDIVVAYKTIKELGKADSTASENSFDQTQHKKFLRKQIDYSISQLKNLKADIKSESLKEDKIKEYIAIERKAILELHKFTILKSEVNTNCISQFDKMKPRIDEILNSSK